MSTGGNDPVAPPIDPESSAPPPYGRVLVVWVVVLLGLYAFQQYFS